VNDLLRLGVPAPGTPVGEQLAGGALVFREGSTESELTVKYDLTREFPLAGKVQSGVSLKRVNARYDAASPFGANSPFFVVPDANPFSLDQRLSSYQFGAYLQGTRSLTSRLSATIGARFDRYQYLDATTLTPRLGLDYALTSRLSLRASYGRYTQQPFLLFLEAYPENRSLDPFRADHYIAGLAYAMNASTRITAEIYRKDYRHYPVSSQIPALSLANAGDTFAIRDILFPMTSAGRGRASPGRASGGSSRCPTGPSAATTGRTCSRGATPSWPPRARCRPGATSPTSRPLSSTSGSRNVSPSRASTRPRGASAPAARP